LVKTNKPLKLNEPKEKDAYPWSGSLRGGAPFSGGMSGINENMPDLARRLSRYLGRPVLDHTGLTGSYDFRTEYRPEGERPDVVSMIFTSLQELGLKLEASKGPIEAIVIEHAEKPSAN
jgi:uncharacterized protein (TIGR03435 family)